MDKNLTLWSLPYYCKKIGFAFIIIILLLIVCIDIFSNPIWKYITISEEKFKTYSITLLFLGMFLIALSKEKDEDEMTKYIRMNIMAKSFQITSYLFVVGLLFNLFNNTPLKKEYPGREIFMLLCFYLIFFYWLKWKTKRDEKRNAISE